MITKDGQKIEPQFSALKKGEITTYTDKNNTDSAIYQAVQMGYNRWLKFITQAEEYDAAAKELQDNGPLREARIIELKKQVADLLVKKHALKLHDKDISGYTKILREQGVSKAIEKLTGEADALASEVRTIEGATDLEAAKLLLEQKSRQSLQSYLTEQELGQYAELLVNNASVESVLEQLRQDAMNNHKTGDRKLSDVAAKMFYAADTVERDWFALRAQEIQNNGEVDKANELLKNGRANYVKALREKEARARSRANSFVGQESVALQRALEYDMNNVIQTANLEMGRDIKRVQEHIDNPADANFFRDKAEKARKFAASVLTDAHAAIANGSPEINEQYGQRMEEKESTPSGSTGGVTIETYIPYPERSLLERFINPEKGEGRGIGGEGKKNGK